MKLLIHQIKGPNFLDNKLFSSLASCHSQHAWTGMAASADKNRGAVGFCKVILKCLNFMQSLEQAKGYK